MKRSEIKVGEEYASTRSRDWMQWGGAERVCVVDLGPFSEVAVHVPRMVDVGVIDGTPTKDNYRRDAKGTYVAVRYIDNNFKPESRVRFVPAAHLKATWADYLEARAAVAKARSEQNEREKDRAEKDRAERAELAEIAERAGVALDFVTKPGKVTVSRDDLRRLLDAVLVKTEGPGL